MKFSSQQVSQRHDGLLSVTRFVSALVQLSMQLELFDPFLKKDEMCVEYPSRLIVTVVGVRSIV